MEKAEKLLAAQGELASELMQVTMKNSKTMLDLQLQLSQDMAALAMKTAGEAMQIKDPAGHNAWRMKALESQTQMLAGYAQKLQTVMMESNGAVLTIMTRRMSKAGGDAMADMQSMMGQFAKPQDAMKQMQEMFKGPLAAMQDMVKGFSAAAATTKKAK
jgi:hypothetical protein